MGTINYKTLLFFLLSMPFLTLAQDTLRLSREQAETLFLKENLQLLAERLQISQAEAMVLQAKLWPNPGFSVEEVNLWGNEGDSKNNQQLVASLEQVIQTAGKRKKLMALERVSVEKSKEYFEDLLRSLKLEFRNLLTELQYLQFSSEIYENQIHSVKKLTQSYQRQVEQGHIARGEYIRLKALELEITKDLNEIHKNINKSQKELKLLMRLPAAVQLKLTKEGYLKQVEQIEILSLVQLLEQAKENNPNYKLSALDKTYFDRLYKLEKANRVPDVALQVNYDRAGNFRRDFIGVGLEIELPVFDRNQGNIRSAELGKEKAQLIFQQKELSLENETAFAVQNLNSAIRFFNEIETDYETTLDTLLSSYTKNFTNRNISLLEYLDFLETYLENKKIILEAGKEVNERTEELNFTIGKDVIN